MSDEEEYEYDYGSEQEMEEEGAEAEEGAVEVENAFYEADDLKRDAPARAMGLFAKVVAMEAAQREESQSECRWTFKALQHMVVLGCQLDLYADMVASYEKMLTFIGTVTRNECTNAINDILDKISRANDIEVLSKMYEITLEALKSAKNESMWFQTNIKLAKLYLESRKVTDIERLLSVLKTACQLPDGSDDDSRGAYLLEIYCVEVQLCAMLSDSARLRRLYPRITKHTDKAAVSDPRVMGIIREEIGKMFMREGNWDAAYAELNEAFRKYQEVGNARAKDCLKYLVLTSMLALKDINPFSAKEAKVFTDDREIQAMSELRSSLEASDLKSFERILGHKQNRIADEPFLMTYIEPLRRRMQEQVLLRVVRPFSAVTVAFLSGELLLPEGRVHELLLDMVGDERLDGRIDQVAGVLRLGGSSALADAYEKRSLALGAMAEAVSAVGGGVLGRLVL